MIAKTLFVLLLAASSFAGAAEQQAPAAKRASPVASGDAAPDFSLPDQNGRSHSLSAERGKRPVILVFYRGYW